MNREKSKTESRSLAFALLLLIPLSFIPNTGHGADTIVLYNGGQGTMPEAQGWIFYPPLAFLADVTHAYDPIFSAVRVDTTATRDDMSGYFSSTPAVTISIFTFPAQSHPDMPNNMDSVSGFTVSFEAQVVSEGHNYGDRAGFSVIATSSDITKSIEIGFWEDSVWAQEGGPEPDIFTRAENTAFNTGSMVAYDLVVQNNAYQLKANGSPILSGPMRDYSNSYVEAPFNHPYVTPNFIFLGDDTSSADAEFLIRSVSVTVHDAPVPTPIVVAPVTISATTETTATLAASATGDGITSAGFTWRTAAGFNSGNVPVGGHAGAGSFAMNLTALDPATTYFVRAWTSNGANVTYGAETSFATDAPATLPTAILDGAPLISATAIQPNGEVTDDGGATVTARGFVYATASGPTLADTSLPAGSGEGAFAATAGNLQPGRTYYFRAYATSSAGTAYSNEIAVTPPTVTTGSATAVTVSGATLGGTSSGDGITARGISWRTSNGADSGELSADQISGNAFSATLGGLSPATGYRFRAFITVAGEKVFGEEGGFTTVAPVPPTVTISDNAVLTGTGVQLYANVTNPGTGSLSARGVALSQSPNPDLSDTLRTAGSGTGAFSVTFDGLTPGATYYFRAWATNPYGTAFSKEISVRLPLPGDLGGDGAVGLEDAIIGLKLLSGVSLDGKTVDITADVDGDGKVGLPEVIHILREVAKL